MEKEEFQRIKESFSIYRKERLFSEDIAKLIEWAGKHFEKEEKDNEDKCDDR